MKYVKGEWNKSGGAVSQSDWTFVLRFSNIFYRLNFVVYFMFPSPRRAIVTSQWGWKYQSFNINPPASMWNSLLAQHAGWRKLHTDKIPVVPVDTFAPCMIHYNATQEQRNPNRFRRRSAKCVRVFGKLTHWWTQAQAEKWNRRKNQSNFHQFVLSRTHRYHWPDLTWPDFNVTTTHYIVR